MVLISLLISVQPVDAEPHKAMVHRVNYGVIFRKEGRMYSTEQAWRHTFQIQLPYIPMQTEHQPASCENQEMESNLTHCSAVLNLVTHLGRLRNNTINTVREACTEVINLIPEAPLLKVRTRQHRALLSFIGDWSKTLFGTATVKDIETLKDHVATIARQTDKLVHAFTTHTGGMQSYMSAIDQRVSNAMQAVEDNHNDILTLATQVANSLNAVRHDWKIVLKSMIIVR